MGGDTRRSVSMERVGKGRYEATNARGGKLTFGEGDEGEFTPVELLLVAIGGCSAIDIDYIAGKRAEPTRLDVTVTGDKIKSAEHGNHLENLSVTFTVSFPAGEGGDAAREILPAAVKRSHDRLCTVSRTVEAGAPVEMHLG